MRKTSLLVTSTVATAFLISSCATIVSGTKPKVTINGDAKEPVTIKTSYTTYEKVVLPTQVRLKRKHLSGQRINVTSPNYTYSDIIIEKKTNGWAWGNLVLGGVIGWVIDLGTNCVSEPREYQYYVHGEPKTNDELMKEKERDNSNVQLTNESNDSFTLNPIFPHEAIIENRKGSQMEVVINSIDHGFILYHQKKDSQYKTSTIETSQIKNVRLSLDENHQQPSFPCEAIMMFGKNSRNTTEVIVMAINQDMIQYSIKGKTYSQKIDKIKEIAFLLPNSMKEYNCKIYSYMKK